MADQQIMREALVNVPSAYVLQPSARFTLKAVYADMLDNGAAGDWLPCVTIYSDSGHVIAQAVDQGVKVTAGDDAQVSWFPGVKHAVAATPSGGGAPDYIMMAGVSTAIPSVPGGASGVVPWSVASVATNDLALWGFGLNGAGDIIGVTATAPGRYESFSTFRFFAPSASVEETYSMGIQGGIVTPITNSVALVTASDWQSMVSAFGASTSGTITFDTEYDFNNAASGHITGERWWIKRYAL